MVYYLRRLPGGNQDIEITYRLLLPPVASSDLYLLKTTSLFKEPYKLHSKGLGIGPAKPPALLFGKDHTL